MSYTLELLTTVEHGTVDGYRAGCHGSANACGAPVSCVTVFTRYQGDWGFRKRVDAGETPADILAEELAEADAVRARDKAANRKAKTDASKTNDARLAKQRSRSALPKERELGVVDRIINDVARLVGEGKTSKQIAAELNASETSVGRAREALKIPTSRKTVDRAEVARLHALGWNDTRIAEHLGVSNTSVSEIRRNELDLPRISGTNTRKPRKAAERLERSDLHDDAREARTGVIEAHGTQQGYVDGCRGRGCPATPSCTDAALEANRAARREAGGQS